MHPLAIYGSSVFCRLLEILLNAFSLFMNGSGEMTSYPCLEYSFVVVLPQCTAVIIIYFFFCRRSVFRSPSGLRLPASARSRRHNALQCPGRSFTERHLEEGLYTWRRHDPIRSGRESVRLYYGIIMTHRFSASTFPIPSIVHYLGDRPSCEVSNL